MVSYFLFFSGRIKARPIACKQNLLMPRSEERREGMFLKKCEPKCMMGPCAYIAVGMLMAFGVVACTKPGRKFIKSKISCMASKMENCSALSS